MSTDNPRNLEVTVRAMLDGWPCDVHLSLPAQQIPVALGRLREYGYSPRAAAAPQKPPRPRATHFSPDGTPLCPVHNTPMREGQHGWYCARKAAEGEPATPKGYCSAIAD